MSKAEEYLNKPIPIQEQLLKLFDLSDSLIILDIGSCEGLDSIRYAKLFPKSTVYAFEPVPDNVLNIKKNIARYGGQNIKVIQEALSEEKGTSGFFVSSGHPDHLEKSDDWDYGNKSSSLLPPDKTGKEIHKWLKFDRQIQVPTNTLENFYIQHKIDTIDFIHMDVQGAELKVLKGAKDYLKNIKMIWMEVEKVSLYKGQPLKDEVEKYMKENGFVKIMDTVGKISGDQLYVNKEDEHKFTKKKHSRSSVKGSIKKQIKSILKPRFQKTDFAKKTYSQCGEDVIIQHIFKSLKIQKPSYIDVGAHHPFHINNTAIFYENGSRGINIEPDPTLCKEFFKHRKEDINLNIGISNQKDELDFYVMSAPTLNTFSKSEAEKYVEEYNYKIVDVKKIKVDTLESILDSYRNSEFPHLLSLDVEGLDEQILTSINYEKSAPIVICVETISFSNKGRGIKQNHLIEYLESKGYLSYADSHINTIFVKKDHWLR